MSTNTMVYYTTSNDDVYLQDVLPTPQHGMGYRKLQGWYPPP